MKRIKANEAAGRNATAIRIKNGEFYFLGWDESEEEEKILKATSNGGIRLFKNHVIFETLYHAVTSTDEYSEPLKTETVNGNAIDELIKLLEPQYVNPDSYDIFEMTQKEFNRLCKFLRDGDYIIVIQDDEENPAVKKLQTQLYKAITCWYDENQYIYGIDSQEWVNIVCDSLNITSEEYFEIMFGENYMSESECENLQLKAYKQVCIEAKDIKKVDKIISGIKEGNINKANLFEEVKKLTQNVKSDHAIKRWQIIVEWFANTSWR